MNEYCYEDLIKRDNGKMEFLFPVLSYSAFTVFAVVFNIVPILLGINIIYFTGMISFGIWYLIYRMNKKLKVEYEFSIINDQITVTSVTNAKKREELVDFSLRDADYIGPVTKERYSSDVSKAAFNLNITGVHDIPLTDDVWYILVNAGSYRYMISFNFLDEMYANFRRYNPRSTEFMVIKRSSEDEIDE